MSELYPSGGPRGSATLTPPQRLVQLWYAFASPRAIREGDNFAMRDAVRRSRTASWIVLVVMLLVLAPVPAVLSKPFVLVPLAIVFALDCGAFALNRARHTTIAGIILVLTITIGLVGTLLSIPGGVGPADLPLFDLLTQSVVVAAFMIGPRWAFVTMGFNMGLIWVILHFTRLSPEVSHLLITNGNIFTQAAELQAIIALFSFVLVYNSNNAISSLDRSEEIVALERREIEAQQAQLEQKAQLELGMHSLQETLQLAANGNFAARATISQENILWRIAYSLNTLLSRLQNFNQEQKQFQQTLHALRILNDYIRAASEQSQGMVALPRTGTPVDEVILALIETRTIRPSAPAQQPFPPIPTSRQGQY